MTGSLALAAEPSLGDFGIIESQETIISSRSNYCHYPKPQADGRDNPEQSLEDFIRQSSISYHAHSDIKHLTEEVYPRLLQMGSILTEDDSEEAVPF